MHKSILDATIKSVRLRDSQGDCPTEPAFSVEHLEGALLTLADELAPQPADAVREALTPFAKLAADSEWNDVPDNHVADVVYRSMAGGEETIGTVTFGELRNTRAALASDPAPAGEAVEPVMWRRRGKHRWFYREHAPTSQSGSGWLPLYAHPAPEDTARLREDLERVTRVNASMAEEIVSIGLARDAAERERDDARKALETVQEALKPFSDYADPLRTAYPDDMPMTKGSAIAARQVTAGDFRRAREAYHAAARSASSQGCE